MNKDPMNPEIQFSLDELISAEYHSAQTKRNVLESEKDLMLAVLKDGIALIIKGGKSRKKRAAKEAAQDERWIIDKNDEWIFSFENICETLGINPGALRQGILKKKKDAGVKVKRENQRKIKLNRRYARGRR